MEPISWAYVYNVIQKCPCWDSSVVSLVTQYKLNTMHKSNDVHELNLFFI